MSKKADSLPGSFRPPVAGSSEDWRIYWKAIGLSWRIMPEINEDRQRELTELLAIVPDIEKGRYPFREVELSRADVEWLLVAHGNGRGSVDWRNENERQREGLDLRGADLGGIDLSDLPLARLRGGLSIRELENTTAEQRHMAGIHLEGANLIRTHLEGAILHNAYLREANLIEVHLEEAFLDHAHLEKANLFQADLKGANFSFAHLDGANLIKACLQSGNLSFAHLEKALFSQAHLEGANLVVAHLEGANLAGAYLGGADLQCASLDRRTVLEDAILGSGKRKFVSLANVRWSDTNLTVVDWLSMKMLGDEYEARQRKTSSGQVKGKEERLGEFKTAVQANRQLALVLRSHGMNEEADHFAYRAQLLQRVVWRRRHRLLKYVFSWFLYLLAGYGYRPLRTLFIYLLGLLGFALAYCAVTHGLHAQPYPLNFFEALVLSVSSFHGRGFFQPMQNLGDPVALLAATEAVIGLVIELSFIATFTQRFFGK